LRVEAIRVLGRLKQPAEPLVSALCAIASDPKSSAGVQALEALGEFGPAAKPALPVLLGLVNKPELAMTGGRWGPAHRAAVIRSLGQIGPEAASAVPALLALPSFNNYFIRREVAMAAAHMGPGAGQMLATRDAVGGASIALLAAPSQATMGVLPLVQIVKRIWIPRNLTSVNAIHQALLRIDPSAVQSRGSLEQD
jgi:HEAT repeat protein